jgi:hypothetical protein
MAIEYNVLALRGADIKDKEYVEMYNLDPELANTPKINDAMLDLVYNENISDGVGEQRANELRTNAKRDINILLAKKGLLPNKK